MNFHQEKLLATRHLLQDKPHLEALLDLKRLKDQTKTQPKLGRLLLELVLWLLLEVLLEHFLADNRQTKSDEIQASRT
jgi:hypothetical protein